MGNGIQGGFDMNPKFDMTAQAARAERIREMRDEGKTPQQIAGEMRLDEGTVYRAMRKFGIPCTRYRPVPDDVRASVRRALMDGMSQRETAAAHGISTSTICKWLARGVI